MATEKSKKAMEIRKRNKRRRVSVDLPPEELDRAKATAANLGVPFAALLRAALDHLLDARLTADDLEAYIVPRGRRPTKQAQTNKSYIGPKPEVNVKPATKRAAKSAAQRARELLNGNQSS